jgi:hydroxypyruvate isomerase
MKEVKKAGLDSFEFWGWWDKDTDAILKAKNELALTLSAMCTRMISLVDEEKRGEYLAGLKESIETAKKLGCAMLITQSGNELTDRPRPRQQESLAAGLKACVPMLEASGITLVFEPLNTLVDHKGYYLWSADEAFEIAEGVGSPYVKVLFDIYHQQITEGNIISRITRNIGKIGHFHCAGNPGRNELWKGEINYPEIFKVIDASGYNGYLGLEYFPLDDAAAGLAALVCGGQMPQAAARQ